MAVITYYCSNEETNGYGPGSDTPVDPTDKLTPYLTANVALDFYALSAQDGDILVFNDGTYVYTNGAGRYILSHLVSNVQFENDYLTTLVFSGTNAQGLRYNGSDSETKNNTMGKGIITTLNAAKTTQVVLSANSATNLRMTVNWSARIDPDPAGAASAIGLSQSASNLELNILDGGSTGITALDYRPIYQNPAVLVQQIDIDIQRWVFDLEFSGVGGVGAIDIDFDNANASGSVAVSGVTGSLTDVDTDVDTSIGVHLRNCPDGSSIEGNDDLTIVTANANKLSTPWVIDAPVADAITCDGAIIRNNKRCTLTTVGGFCALIGGEGVDHNTPNGVIEGNEFRLTNFSASTALHGVCHIGCVDGIRRNNKIDGAAIGSLTKLGSAVSYDNFYRNIGGVSKAFLYAKGAEAGSEFFNEICEIPDGFSGVVEQCLFDDVSLQISTDTKFRANKVSRISDDDLAAGARLHLTGSGAEASTSTSIGMTIDENLTLPTVVASIAGTTYATIALANATASIDSMTQDTINSLQVAKALTPGISGLALSFVQELAEELAN